MSIRFIGIKILLLIALVSSNLTAQTKGTGLGLSFGEPTAVDLKTWVSSNSAIDIMAGSSVATEYYRVTITADYLFHSFNAFSNRANVPLYYGAGISAGSRSDGPMRYGVRGVIGLFWYTKNFPVDFYVQAAPTLHVSPTAAFWLNASAGFRYFFRKAE